MALETTVQQVRSLIESTPLGHTEHKLLSLFVEDAVDPSRAAKYILDRIAAESSSSREKTLRSIKDDWRSLLHRCKLFISDSCDLELH